MAHDTFTLRGKHTTPAGTAHAGRVKVRPNTTLRDSAGGVVLSGDEVATLDATGAWSLVLPCDSPGLNPSTGLAYTVTYQLAASGVNSQTFAAPALLAGTTVDVAQITTDTSTLPIPVTTVVVVGGIALDTDGVPYFP